jgi:hypothetical protein
MERLEPTTGLEPVTCRLRIDPALRKLLCNEARFGAFRGVSGISGAIYTAVVQQKNGRLRSRSGVVTSLDGRVVGALRAVSATFICHACGSQDDEWRARQSWAGLG